MANAACPGVRLLSGFSPALLKLVLTGEEADEDEVETVDGVSATKARPTPYQTMRKALDAPRYDAVQMRFTEIQAAAEPLAVGVQLAEVRLFYGRRRLSIASASAVDADGPAAHNASNAADGLLPTKWLDSALLGRRGRSAG